MKDAARPPISTDKRWTIEAVAGPNDDWIDQAGHERFLASPGSCPPRATALVIRLDGPEWTFTDKAYNKSPEHGAEPSNIIDQGYPLGAINLAGQTPIILVNEPI